MTLNAVELDDCLAEIASDDYPSRRPRGAASNNGGGNVEDVLRRLGALEACVLEMKTQLSAITAVIPHLATKSDLSTLETRLIKWNIATIITSVGLAFSIAKIVH